MKNIIAIAFLFLAFSANAQDSKSKQKKTGPKPQIVEASCGQCQFGMKGHGCDLAVRIDGKPYFVDGTGIDDHGDSHAGDGFCSKIRKAEVVGEVKNNRFVATSFKLLPEKPKGK
ncbi:hypothetical protein GGR22_000979 [Flavobacterium gossypii]|jgi:hypothetical protein|uniref:Glutaminyl-tRNA synthetase n=1 Tax=Flavobacterium gossypii TaxID=1646119 RepID=A0ABR6DME4_9FLAO|nr:DUF6370 family protein [Flavobacterium gossypii]MBA9072853.1 hypothetical protein [Flavobacterium gossypii]